MTHEQEALVEALRVASPSDEYNQPPLSLLRYIPSVRAVILALAAERDRWRLRCEWQEARAESFAAQLEYAELNPEVSRKKVSAETLNEADDRMMLAAEKRDAAKAAYVAAGGTP